MRRLAVLLVLPAAVWAQRREPAAIRREPQTQPGVAQALGAQRESFRAGAIRGALGLAGSAAGALIIVGEGTEDIGSGLALAALGGLAGPWLASRPKLESTCSSGARFARGILGGLVGGAAALTWIAAWDGNEGVQGPVIPVLMIGAGQGYFIARCRVH